MIANRNKTLAEIKEKRRKYNRPFKVRYHDWAYSFGINPPEIFRQLFKTP